MNTIGYAHCSLLISGGKQRNEMCTTPTINTHFQVNQIPFSSPNANNVVSHQTIFARPNACKLICTKNKIYKKKHEVFHSLCIIILL